CLALASDAVVEVIERQSFNAHKGAQNFNAVKLVLLGIATVQEHFTVPGRANTDGLLQRALRREDDAAVVPTRMDAENITRLDSGRRFLQRCAAAVHLDNAAVRRNGRHVTRGYGKSPRCGAAIRVVERNPHFIPGAGLKSEDGTGQVILPVVVE